MKTIHQYINEKTGQRYYYTLKSLVCFHCNEFILDFVVVHLNWNKKKSVVFELCFNCSKKYKSVGVVEEKFTMSIVKQKPRGAKLVLITPPELKNNTRDDSLFCNTLDSPRVNNKAVRSGHPSYTVLDDSAPVLIGQSINQDEEVKKDKLIESEDELDALFLSFKNEQVLIGDDEDKKLLE